MEQLRSLGLLSPHPLERDERPWEQESNFFSKDKPVRVEEDHRKIPVTKTFNPFFF